ncbi:hypothetical protein TGPRC2_289790 [Toxoplasma gondii TgCatPRC2]|uniref:Uncharacterized protein n=3 Tax=Toxoplasma gondii TaxID=5811 RepID=A0A151HJV2_TOXGO|nr:hypothetical protein TGME49_289790 [Toxoplasma gondii ME49]EPT27975.1 hypothetical protein TGME49_289790 [Toxoplasma gondii ME49]KYF45103.1 hypothetical protein TGARI_289790 [Toxoplasma gondii ARI]KYK69594.1 hypothetical protein TGPRC2_289790 [Toxoplasma gondii TgCatPRC2]|eukprot:XP_018636419.1 hypothetical protein TGME49_289790 [Toxoplasma gondii ME49]
MLHALLPSTAKMQFPLRRRHTDDEPLPLPSSFSDQASFPYPPDSLLPICAAGRASSFSSSSVASSQVTSSHQTLKRSAPVACEGRRRSAAGWRSSPRSSFSSLGSEGVGGLTENQVVSLSFLKNRSFAGPPTASSGFGAAGGPLEEEASNAQSPKRRRSGHSESDGSRPKRRKETRSHESSPQALSSCFSIPSIPGKERTDAVLTLPSPAVASPVSRSALPSSFLPLKEAGEKTSRQCLPVSVAPEEASPSALEGPHSLVATSPRSSSRWPVSPLSRCLSFSPRYSNFPALSPLIARRGRPGAAESLREEAADISGFPSRSGSLDPSRPTTETVSKSAKEETKPLPPTCAVSSPRSPPFSSSSSASSSSPSSSFPSSESCSSSSGRVDKCGTCGCRILFPSLEVALERQRRTPRKARRCMEREAVTGERGAEEEAEKSRGSDEENGARNGLEAKGFGRQKREKSRERDTCSAEPDPRLQCNACRSRVYIQSFFDDLRLLATGFHSDLRSLTRAVAFSPQKKTFLLNETERSSAPGRLGAEQRTTQSLFATSVSSSPSCRCPICTSFLSLYSEDRRAVFCREQRPGHERKGAGGGAGDKEEREGEKEGGKEEGLVEKPDSVIRGDAVLTPVRPKSLQCLLRAAGRQCCHLQEQVERLSSEDQAFSEREQADLMRSEDGEKEESTNVTLQRFRGFLEALHVANETKLEHLLQVLAKKGGNAALALSDRFEDLRTSLPGFHSSAVLLLAPASRGVAPSVGFSQVSEVRESSMTKKFLDASNVSLPSPVSASAGEAVSSGLSLVPSASAGVSCLEKEGASPGAPCASSVPRLWRTPAQAGADSSIEDSSSSRDSLLPRENCAANKQRSAEDGGARKRDSASHSPRTLLKRLGLSEATLRMLDPLSKQGRDQKRSNANCV